MPAVLTDITDTSAKLNSPINKQNIELSVLTPDKAQEIFDKLAARDDIPFKYAKDGCFSRAHKMVTIMDEEKIVAGKVFAQGKFFAQTLSGPVFWTYHLAPIILVKTENEIVPKVLSQGATRLFVTTSRSHDCEISNMFNL
ncbi:MAG: hypothetical protein H7177_04125 [Rhizobacter sp.]|nr:hypothetical protein [Bacteriovorax sp.]